MTDSQPICMCGAKARQAYNDDGVKIPKCARCGNAWPDSRTPMERMLDQPSPQPTSSPANPSFGVIRGIAWLAAIIASGVAVIYWISAQAGDDQVLSAIQGTQVATEAMAIAVVPTCIALALDRLLK